MTATHPRLLVATEFPPNASGGGPAIVRQMLREWPVENLFWWSCLPDRDCHFGQKVAALRAATIPARLYPRRRWCLQKSWLLEQVWARRAAHHLRRTLVEFKPDAVWVIPQVWAISPLATALPPANIGFHVSMHDYVDSRSGVSRCGADRSRRMALMADKLYAEATTRDAISHPMVVDLRARTGCDGGTSRAGLEETDFEYLANRKPCPANGIRIAYAGTIVVEETFALFVAAMERIRHRLSAPVTLEFFGADSYPTRRWFDSAWMRSHGNLPEEALSRALRECTWGFAPMSFSDDDPRYNRFSLPTKFISYLAAGLPVITLGHPETSVTEIARAYQVGFCATANRPEQLGAELLAALTPSDASMTHRSAIFRCGKSEFDARTMRAELYRCFFACARVSMNRRQPDEDGPEPLRR